MCTLATLMVEVESNEFQIAYAYLTGPERRPAFDPISFVAVEKLEQIGVNFFPKQTVIQKEDSVKCSTYRKSFGDVGRWNIFKICKCVLSGNMSMTTPR